VSNPIQLTSGTPTTFGVTVTTAKSFLLPYSSRRPLPPPALYVMLVTVSICFAMLLALYQFKLRGGFTQRQFAFSGGFLILVLAVYGLAGCASGNTPGPGPVPPQTGTQKGTYTLTLTPAATSTSGKPLTLTPIQLTLTVN
jgi:hypothetical protein